MSEPEDLDLEPTDEETLGELLAFAASNNNLQLTPHFNCLEFLCRCSRHQGPYVGGVDRSRLPPGGVARCRQTAEWMERVRAALGNEPIHVASCYRCPPHNAEIGGALRSIHLIGKAVDFTHRRLSPAAVQKILVAHWGAGKMVHGLGASRSYTHADWGDRIARWRYSSSNRPIAW